MCDLLPDTLDTHRPRIFDDPDRQTVSTKTNLSETRSAQQGILSVFRRDMRENTNLAACEPPSKSGSARVGRCFFFFPSRLKSHGPKPLGIPNSCQSHISRHKSSSHGSRPFCGEIYRPTMTPDICELVCSAKSTSHPKMHRAKLKGLRQQAFHIVSVSFLPKKGSNTIHFHLIPHSSGRKTRIRLLGGR